jgi:hypothetical protein
MGRLVELKDLEKEWQNTYFEMVEKEEKIREAELSLREILKEFTGMCETKREILEHHKNLIRDFDEEMGGN